MELITMTAEEGRTVIKEIMGAYDNCRKIWIDRFGTPDGFDAWFSKQTAD